LEKRRFRITKGGKMKEKEVFEKLFQKDVSKYTEKKNGLTYLSWANAWAEVKKEFPDANYEIVRCPTTRKPYLYDDDLGYLVMTEITIQGQTYMMWLTVMDGANKAMKAVPYTYKVKKYEWNEKTRRKEFIGNYEEKTVESATMFDINTAIMRCLTKNLAMFGLGLYIYAGEDLPEQLDDLSNKEVEPPKKELKKEKRIEKKVEEKSEEAKPEVELPLEEWQEKVRNNLLRLYNRGTTGFETPEKVREFLRDKTGIKAIQKVDEIKKLETLKMLHEHLNKREEK
jgi:hypothetical protein